MGLVFLIALCVFGAILITLQTVTAGRRRVAVQLARAIGQATAGTADGIKQADARDRLLVPVAQRLSAFGQRLTPGGNVESVRKKLAAAGMRGTSPSRFFAIKGGILVGGVAFGLLMLGSSPAFGLFLMVGGAGLGFIGPDYILTLRARARKEGLIVQLPNVLDLLTVSVEAGLGFDAAVAKLSERMEGPLVEEFRIVLHETRIGESRQQALRNLADRVDAVEMTSLVRAIIQADQLGISLGRILRIQSDDIRNRRQMAAEEKAMKAPVKMLIPTAIFIFPPIFIVSLGPAMITLVNSFSAT
jgi:tight adherence protein C